MANYRAISAAAEAVRLYLQSTYPPELNAAFPCGFSLLSTGQLAEFDDPQDASTAVSLFVYRVTVNQQLRNTFQPGSTPDGFLPALPVDLHVMLSVWASSAQAELTVYAWAIRQMTDLQVLDTSLLGPEAGWAEGDLLQVLPAELSIEDEMRIWDAVEPGYRLSTQFVVRAIRLDSSAPAGRRVVATRFSVGKEGGA